MLLGRKQQDALEEVALTTESMIFNIKYNRIPTDPENIQH